MRTDDCTGMTQVVVPFRNFGARLKMFAFRPLKRNSEELEVPNPVASKVTSKLDWKEMQVVFLLRNRRGGTLGHI
jgi:hypothetical protein